MKMLLLASILFLTCSTAWAAIGSSVVIQPDANNPGPIPPHLAQQWQGSAASIPALPAGSTIYVLPAFGGPVPQTMQTGGNLPPTPYWDYFGVTPLDPDPYSATK